VTALTKEEKCEKGLEHGSKGLPCPVMSKVEGPVPYDLNLQNLQT